MPINSPSYTSQRMSPLTLKLDIRNPRFLAIQPTQENAIIYLLNYAKVQNLAANIIRVGGLYPGERIVVFRNDQNEYIVLEGNRRVCACKLLLNPTLIPNAHRRSFPEITDTVRASITEVDVDIIDSREAADSFLTSRHIGGIEHWDPLAKAQFFESKFANGQSLTDITTSSNYPLGKIKDDIQKYYLFMEAYSLPCWTPEQKSNQLNLFTVEIDKFLRIFDTRGAKSAFRLSFDQITLRPRSTLPTDVFKDVLRRVMYCAYIATNPEEQISTRTKNWRDVPGIQEILARASTTSSPTTQTRTTTIINQMPTQPTSSPTTASTPITTRNNRLTSPPTIPVSPSSPSGQQPTTPHHPNQTPSNNPSPQLTFFESLSWSGVTPTAPENQGLLAIAEEIKKFSTGPRPLYKQVPVAATILLRSLVEQTLKYHLRKVAPQALQCMSTRYDPSLNSLIKYYINNNQYITLISDSNMQRVFSSLFGGTGGLKDFLDLTVHQPHYVRPSEQHLESHARAGLFSFINYILNLP